MWKTIRDYANEKGIATSNIYRAIKNKKINVKQINGVKYVSNDITDIDKPITTQTTPPPASPQQAPQQLTQDEEDAIYNANYKAKMVEKQNVETQLRKEKLANLRQDTILKKQKNALVKQQYRIQFSQGVLQCYTDAFKNFKNQLIDLKLNKDKLKLLQDIFKKDLKKFENNLKKYLATKDDKEESINENTD